MKELKIEIPFRSYQYDELPEADRRLIDAAKQGTYRSFAPYSNFFVGAAIQMANGEIVSGSNQENAAYPSGLCAERTTAFYASSRYPGVGMTTIAVAARCAAQFPEGTPQDRIFQKQPISPCAACRQSLLEYEHLYGPMRVLLYGADEIFEFPSIASLIPYCFTDF